MACINQRCQDPCAEANPCAGNAECRVRNSRPICSCPTGWGGDPQVQCYRRKYQTEVIPTFIYKNLNRFSFTHYSGMQDKC